jgi:hypothetical protein
MKSYLLAFGKALVTSTAIHYIHRRQQRRIFSENRRHRKNYAFPAKIQALNYEIIKFFSVRCQKRSHSRPSTDFSYDRGLVLVLLL